MDILTLIAVILVLLLAAGYFVLGFQVGKHWHDYQQWEDNRWLKPQLPRES